MTISNNNITTSGAADVIPVCANCGKEGDEINNTCNKCKMVMYCNAACKKKHRSKHKKQCERRVAELHDEELFKQPTPAADDCPICFLRMPLLDTGVYKACCGKVICSGCCYEVDKRTKNGRPLCPFCRSPPLWSEEDSNERMRKRVEAGDLTSIYNMGCDYRDGAGLAQDHAKAFELFVRAGEEFGHSKAYTNIGFSYCKGNGVERDVKKAEHYFELGAISGDSTARHNLGIKEEYLGNIDRALKHYMIAIKGGDSVSLDKVKMLYSKGYATKEDFTQALRSYQTYVSEIKSVQRDEAATARRKRYY